MLSWLSSYWHDNHDGVDERMVSIIMNENNNCNSWMNGPEWSAKSVVVLWEEEHKFAIKCKRNQEKRAVQYIAHLYISAHNLYKQY